MQDKLWIYRPIMAGKCTIEGVIDGTVTIEHLLELNALLDMSEAFQAYDSHMREKKR